MATKKSLLDSVKDMIVGSDQATVENKKVYSHDDVRAAYDNLVEVLEGSNVVMKSQMRTHLESMDSLFRFQ